MSLPMRSNVVRLVSTNAGRDCIFNENRKYLVPVYQRDYSWGDTQIEAFMRSIERCLDEQDVFMGTLQFATESDCELAYDIIDGQQRMTTLILFCRVIELLTTRSIIQANSMNLSVLNNVTNQECFFRAVSKSIDEIPSVGNEKKKRKELDPMDSLYMKNLSLIKSYVEEILRNKNQTADELYEAVIQQLYFVELITTNIPLPQVVNIFNTINTTGLDLNCSDLFKLQYYEYLKKLCPKKDNLMKEINDCYEQVSGISEDMKWVLDIYKHCIVAKYDLKFEMLSKSNESFFEEIFTSKDADLRMKIDSVGSNILSLSEFKRLIQVFIELRCQLKPLKPLRPQDSELAGIVKKESFFAIELIELTRYSRYWTLPYVHAFFSCSGAGCKEDRLPIYKICLDTALTISKYLTVCSVTYDKVINPVQTFMCSTILPIMAKSSNVESHKLICEEIEKRITKSPYDPNGGSENKKWFIERISNDLFDNGKRAHIVCVLSGILEEIRCDKDLCHINEQFFSWEKFQFDVEHIYARANFSREDETNSRIYNSIGNLMVLDRNINRSIKDAPVSVKVEKYVGSKFSAVVLVSQKIKKTSTKVWKLEQVQDRLAEQCTLLCEYLGLDL